MAFEHDALGKKKIEVAKELAEHLNQRIPELGYKGGVYTFAPYSARKAVAPYKTADFTGPIGSIQADYDIYGRQTPMGNGLADLEPVLDGLQGRTAVIIFSDGESNRGLDPVDQADIMAAKRLGKLCFHVVSLADKPAGQAVLDSIAAISSCTVSTTADQLMDERAMDDFVQKVFYETEIVPEPVKAKPAAKKPAPAPAPAPAEVVNFRSVNFDFDSAKIKDEFVPVLDEAVGIVKETPGSVVLVGHTDSTGPDAYNQKLSERRAQSVKEYFVAKGIKEGRIEAMGKGESEPKYDNKTREGRALNRRVEMQLK
ncbi:MAG: OmpA family protein [Desulfovibrionaceae bacterium]|nr:OmpA family protein [Desulfovibrionaceae bacterium]